MAFRWHRAVGIVVALTSVAAFSIWLMRQSKVADDALAVLVASMPQPAGRLAVQASPSRGSSDARFDPRRFETWPDDAMRAVETSTNEKGPSQSNLRLAAAVALYQHDCAGAVAILEEALALRSPHAALLNDAAVAYLCLARDAADEAGPSVVRALERTLAASELQPDWPEPQFNLAVAYDAFGLRALARDALRHALERERDDGWRAIVRRRLDTFETPPPTTTPLAAADFQRPLDNGRIAAFVRNSPQTSRETVELGVLESWASTGRSRAGDAAVIESNLRSFAKHRLDIYGDAFLRDTIDAIGRAAGTAREALIRGHLEYARGRALYDHGDREQSGAACEAARRDFLAGGSPFAYEAQLQHGVVLYQLRHLAEARPEIDAVRREAAHLRYPAVEARANWMLGLIDMQQGHVESAVDHYERTIAIYELLHEPENVTSLANSAADTLRTAGDRPRGWRLLMRAAQGLPNLANLQREYLIVFNFSLYAQDEGLLRAAEVFQRAAVTLAEARGAALTIIESHLRHAQLALRRDNVPIAREDLTQTAARIAGLSSQASAGYLAAWKDRIEADLLGRQDPRTAGAHLEALVERFETTEPAEIPSILLEASRSFKRAGDTANAARLLRQAQSFITNRRTMLRAPEYRITYLAAMWEVFHDLIGLEFSQDPAAALRTAEAARRALMTDKSDDESAPLASPKLPDDVAILYYASLQDRLLLWTITSKETTARSLPYPFDELTSDVDAFRRAIESRNQGSTRSALASKIFDRVFDPALAALPSSINTLFIAADGAIGDLPIAALVNSRTNRYLFEHYDLALIPSLFALSDDASESADSVLAVGFNGLPGSTSRLTAAEKEAEAVGDIYGQKTLLIGSSATAAAVRKAAATRSVLHIAAHARANRLMPWKSQLALAPAGDTPGSLDFEQIGGWDLRRCALVVLSACETATGARLRGQGVISLAFPFLTAGAKVVVGTLWQIDDRGADMFMRLFHGYVAKHQPASRAMRLAQRDAAASDDPTLRLPAVWSAYVVNTRVWDARAQNPPGGQSIPGETK